MTISRSTRKSTTKKRLDNGIWKFVEQLDYNKAFGFIYLIREKESGLMYIGKKNFKVGGKLKKGIQSDWRVYTSSSKLVNQRILELGMAAFEFHVLEQYYTRGALGWAETWSQCHVEVPTNNDVWMNRFIGKVQWKSTEVITERHKQRLKKFWKAK